MSYTRTFHKTVTVHYSTSVSYPPSKSGGTISVSGTASENVTVNIHVQTDPFDQQVHACNNNVNLLTGAVAATEIAQVASLNENAKKVGKTIVDGFFKTVRSEISQQISALKSEVDATISHLQALAKRCADKRREMQVGYDRIASQYTKTFTDLNRELENRVYMLDKPAFDLQRHTQKYTFPLLNSELVGGAAVSSVEQMQAAAILSAALSKSLAMNAIGDIHAYLQEQAKAEALLQKCSVPSSGRPVKYAAAIHFQRVAPDRSIKRDTYVPETLQFARAQADTLLQQYNWKGLTEEEMTAINQHFEESLSDGAAKGASAHASRVRETARQLFNSDARRNFSYQN
ncbi:MAG: hypothetical protein NC102_08395 [Clostridium sp.]|nr:hypothetical protein [Clostridium sp.]